MSSTSTSVRISLPRRSNVILSPNLHRAGQASPSSSLDDIHPKPSLHDDEALPKMPSLGVHWTPLKIGLLTAVFLISAWWILPFQLPAIPESIAHGSSPKPATPDQQSASSKDRPLIVYAYHDSESARANLDYFVNKGIHNGADFVFIFNGDANASSTIPDLPNISIVKRDNTCFDMGAIGEVLRKDDLWKKYKRFITMNASIRGPFLPAWSSSCWSDLYLSKVTETTKLVGMTLNCIPRLHVQSMIFATDDVGMGILLDPTVATSASEDDRFGSKDAPVGLSGCYADWNAAVHAEVGTTGLIMNAGYKVDAMMTALHSEEGVEEYCKAHPESGDLLWDKKYFGSNIHPYETVFIKANRNVDPSLMSSMTDWHMRMKSNSFDVCGS
ncbi:hypothetical protein CaCOL14_002057 [Colletotrichum acutatum]|uniref:Uncharacterized protein n=1 Tax=Glomerella acutata TaxID=27357 RepID=A0AAD8UDH7_GLOAC|nr:uncharacterized protein BDZ83DRAFT_633623 [Colletotrichum acutatum]KAK1717411.1 hypothetical protein BDZ83DRAFT_633623 [Colletotrichum acutatum]